MKQDIVTAILKIEEEASKVVRDARARTVQINEERKQATVKTSDRLEKEFYRDIEELKAQIQKKQQDEEEKLKQIFGQEKGSIEEIAPEALDEMVSLVLKRLGEAK